MICEMKKVTILARGEKKKELILSLRNLGIVHVDNVVKSSKNAAILENSNDSYKKVLSILDSYVDKKKEVKNVELNREEADKKAKELFVLLEEENKTKERLRTLSSERDRISSLGDFDPKEISQLKEKGIDISLYSIGKKDRKLLEKSEEVSFISIKSDGKSDYIALVNSALPNDISGVKFDYPSLSLSEIESEILALEMRIKEIENVFTSSLSYKKAFSDLIKKNEDEIYFIRVTDSAEDSETITYISGYIPFDKTDEFKSYCLKENLGYVIDDIKDEDNPPTLLKHKGFIRIVQPLYDMLGLVPGYREKDVSQYFLVFMALFVAMILGDAGYGLLIVLLALLINIKSKKCNDTIALVYLLGGATVVWGALTGTWFGSELVLKKLPFLQLFVIPSLTNFPELFSEDPVLVQNNVMTFCFSIGAIHLSLARAICIFDKIKKKDLSLIADFGWLMNAIFLYLLALYLVIDAPVPLGPIALGVIVDFLLVCSFSAMEPGKPFLKGFTESLAGFFTNFLDTISCFSNVMSYIRLFAVGLASLAIAQSFNGMAEGMMKGFTIPLGILILLLGHGVNIVMGFLSVVVHGVRLNIMEFSGQVGVEWSGYKYEPFSSKGVVIENEETQRS